MAEQVRKFLFIALLLSALSHLSFIDMGSFLPPLLTGFRIILSLFTKEDSAIPMKLYNKVAKTKLVNPNSQDALCIVAPDYSGSIYFYLLEKKGFGFNNVIVLSGKFGLINKTGKFSVY